MDSDTLYDTLMNKTLNFVSYRPRSRREVVSYIEKSLKRMKTEGAFVVEKVLTRLTELGYVDDVKFATWWISQRNSHRPKGLRALQFELQSKGIAPASTAAAVAAVQKSPDGESEIDLAKKAVQKKIVLWAYLPIIEQKKKIYSFLSIRGFGSGTISKIIDELGKKEYNE
jgi:regulatory protein